MDARTTRLLALVRDPTTDAADVTAAWRELFALDATVATSAAFDLLAGEPRDKPSRRLVIDPGDVVRGRWDRRVAAAAALLDSPAAARVGAELADELAHDPQLAADVQALLGPGGLASRGTVGRWRI